MPAAKRNIKIWTCLTAALLFLLYAERTAETVTESLTICARSIVPSLFPYMVISALLTQTGAGAVLGRVAAYPVRWLFGFSAGAAPAIVLGALCGFPVGALAAVNEYEAGQLSKPETERVLAVCNNTGPAFLTGVIGGVYWNDAAFGVFLYIIQIAAAVLIGILSADRNRTVHMEVKAPAASAESQSERFLSQLARAVTSASQNMVVICGFILFFSVIVDLLLPAFEMVCPSGYLGAAVVSFLEFSAAARCAVLLPNAAAAAGFTAFAVGWAGISVHAQITAFAGKHCFHMGRYYFCKLLQGALCAISAYFYVKLTGIVPCADTFAGTITYLLPYAAVMDMVFLGGCAYTCLRFFGGIGGKDIVNGKDK